MSEKMENIAGCKKTARRKHGVYNKENRRKHYLDNREKNLARNKVYYLAHKAEIAAGQKVYYEANKNSVLARNKEWFKKNKGKDIEYSKKYRAKNPEKRARLGSLWRKKNADKLRGYRRKRRAVESMSQHEPYSDSYIYERDGWICGICGQKINKKLKHPNPRSKSIDHIVPLARGGADAAINLQPAHLRCNLSKQAGSGGQLRLIG